MPRFLDVSTLSTARDYLEVPSDYDPRLDDTRTPTDGSVTAAKLHADLNLSASPYGGGVAAGSSTASNPFFSINAAAGEYRSLGFLTAGSPRWLVRTTSAAESGSDAGSDLEVVSRTDAGASKTTVMTVTRSTGVITLGGQLSTAASAGGGAGLLVPHGSTPSSPANGEIWTTTAGLFVQINGSTVGPLS